MLIQHLTPLHVHVWKGERIAKFWIEPTICLALSYGFNSGELNECVKVIEKNRELIERCWNEHFSN